MARIKPFAANVEVTGEFLRQQPEDAQEIAHRGLVKKLSGSLTGPRGGRYEPFGDIQFAGPSPDLEQFHRDIYWFVARRNARYVRPSR